MVEMRKRHIWQKNFHPAKSYTGNTTGNMEMTISTKTNTMSILDTSVSWFKSYHDPVPAGQVSLLNWLRSSKLKDQVQQIRESPDKATADKLKALLPAITPSGTFTRRTDKDLVAHSGFICIDIDLKGNEQIRNYDQLKEQLSRIKQVAYCGLSVSGNGYFALIPIAYPEKHLQHFLALEAVFAKIGIRLDEKCKNLSRLRGYSFDPDAYFNHQAEPFTALLDYPTPPKPANYQRLSFQPASNFQYSDAEKVEALLQKIESGKVDITDGYNHWFAIACNFAATFGEQGSDFFHRVSAFNPGYSPKACDRKFENATKKTVGAQSDLGAFINRCKDFGLYQSNGNPGSHPLKPGVFLPTSTPSQVPAIQVAEEPPSLPIEQKPITRIIRPELPKAEIPLYIKELEEKLNNLKRPLPVVTLTKGESIIDPEKFIDAHIQTIKTNFLNPTFHPFYVRLKQYLTYHDNDGQLAS
jgi:hypothetical protein